MGAFDKVLEFFGLKGQSVELPPSAQPVHDADTHRGRLRQDEREPSPSDRQGLTHVGPTPSGGAPSGFSSSRPSTDPLPSNEAAERERRERERLEERLRASEAERERLERERNASPSGSSDESSGESTGAAAQAPPDSVTGNHQRAQPSGASPQDDRTVNPNAVRPTGNTPTGVLVAITGPNVGEVWALSTGRNMVGRRIRGAKIAVPLKDEQRTISREHCEIECTGDRFTISPIKSSHGEFAHTVVNDNALEAKAVLRDGATIRISDNVLRFRTLEGPA